MGFAQPTTSRAGESATYGSAERFLSLLADSSRPPVAAHDIAVIVAHPDDETVGCGAQLPRLDDATVSVLTDGAPRRLSAATEHGCASDETYAKKLQHDTELVYLGQDRLREGVTALDARNMSISEVTYMQEILFNIDTSSGTVWAIANAAKPN